MKDHGARRIAAPLTGIVCAALAAAHSAQAQCQYELTALIEGPGCPPIGHPAVLVGTGMNALSHVTGFFHDCSISGHHHGFFWTPETGRVNMHKPPDVWRVRPTDINDNGLIVGWMEITGVGQRGFVYDRHTQQYLALLEPLHGVGGSSLSAINNSGVAVGSRSIGKPGQSPNPFNAVIWNTNTGEVIDLGVLDGPNSGALGITDSAEFVIGWIGWSTPVTIGFCHRGDDVVMISPFDGADTSTPSDVSENGDVVGTGIMLDASISRAYLWRDGLHLAIIDPAPGFTSTQGVGINNFGQVLYRNSSSASDIVPALWQNGSGWLLSELVLDLSETTLEQPRAINDGGQILTRGLHEGHNVAIVLSPVNQPTGDLNIDCRVDVHDLLILLDAWGPVPRAKRQAGSPADLNGDGVVDVSDLLILLHHWTF